MTTTLPGLVAALAEVDGRDIAMITRVARLVREAGLIPTDKRGFGAAEMTVSAAANLLIAVNGATAPKHAAAAVAEFRSLRQRKKTPPAGSGGLLVDIYRLEHFGEALEFCIARAPELLSIVEHRLRGTYGPRIPEPPPSGLHGVSIIFWLTGPAAEILIEPVELEQQYAIDVDLLHAGFYRPAAYDTDRDARVTVGLRTVLALHRAVSPYKRGLVNVDP